MTNRVLDTVERQSEILFGLIMVLTFTLSISAANDGREEVREVLIGAIGCNIAWGLVDGVMYLMSVLFERGRGRTIARAVQATSDAKRGRELVADALPDPLGELFGEAALETARAKLAAAPGLEKGPRLTWRDFKGAIGVFLLVFLSTFPVVIPFLFVSPVLRATRVSNGVAIVMMFFLGHSLGRYAGVRPVVTGLVMVLLGVALVGVTMAMGG